MINSTARKGERKCLSVMLSQGITYLQISGFWRGCRFVRVRRKQEGAEPVAILYTNINVLNLMRAATGSQCGEIKRGVKWALLSSL